MRVGILYAIEPDQVGAMLAEFAGGQLHGRAVTSTCQLYASADLGLALFLGPAGSYSGDQWLEGNTVTQAWGATYDDVTTSLAEAGPSAEVLELLAG